MLSKVVFENIVANYLPYIVCAVLAVVFIWTLSETPVKTGTKGETVKSGQNTDRTYY